MTNKVIISFAAISVLLWTALITPAWPADKLTAFADIGPVANLAREIGGQRVQVSVLVPPGRDPHTFEPTPRQMAGMSAARLFLNLDMPFARRMLLKLKNANPHLRVVEVAAGIERIPLDSENGEHGHHGEELDPHIWLDPTRAAKMAENLAQAFGRADPPGRDYYQANLERLKVRLSALDAKLKKSLEPYRGREFFVFHPALGYLAQAYGLKQVAVQAGGKEPGAKRLAQLIQRAKEKGVRIVFVEPQFPQGTARALAQAIGGSLVVVDPLAPDYPANLERLAESLAQAMKQEKP
jgi:zinc transport system substrate-binding protein